MPARPASFGHSTCRPVRARLLLCAYSLPVILVGRSGRGNAAGDLRPAGMRPGQRSGERDAGAGDLGAGRVRKSEQRDEFADWRGDLRSVDDVSAFRTEEPNRLPYCLGDIVRVEKIS